MDKYCCDMRGMLSFLILFLLSRKDMSGKELSAELEKRRGDKPSPGTLYPALKALREEGLLSETKEGKTIYFSLTAEGRKGLKVAKEHFCRTFHDLF